MFTVFYLFRRFSQHIPNSSTATKAVAEYSHNAHEQRVARSLLILHHHCSHSYTHTRRVERRKYKAYRHPSSIEHATQTHTPCILNLPMHIKHTEPLSPFCSVKACTRNREEGQQCAHKCYFYFETMTQTSDYDLLAQPKKYLLLRCNTLIYNFKAGFQ